MAKERKATQPHDLESLCEVLKSKGVTRFLLEFGAEDEDQGQQEPAIGFRVGQEDEDEQEVEGE